MARISRKNVNLKMAIEKSEKIHTHKVVMYLRLSIEDSTSCESESIENQRLLINDYIKHHPELVLYKEYSDDGKTGTNFNRSGFIDMMREIKEGKADCIVVKDLSRFARNFEESEDYLLRIFPILNVRFIAINDDVDTFAENFDEKVLSISLKNLFNDYYAKNVSKNVGPIMAQIKDEGGYWGARPPYGYMIDPEDYHHLVIDWQTAPIVQEIFKRFMSGDSYYSIVKWLQKNKIKPPARYLAEKGLFTTNRYNTLTKWYKSTLKGFLINPVYAGHLVKAKHKRSLWFNIPEHKIPREQWECVFHMHEAIIRQNLFDKVQIEIAKRENTFKNKLESSAAVRVKNIYQGKVKCGCCHRTMIRTYFNLVGGKRAYYFKCTDYSTKKGADGCSNTYIRETFLNKTVLNIIQEQIKATMDLRELTKYISKKEKLMDEETRIAKISKDIQKRMKQTDSKKMNLYSDLKLGYLNLEEYQFAKNSYENEISRLKKSLEVLQKEYGTIQEQKDVKDPIFVLAEEFWKEEELTENMINSLVYEIVVETSDRICVKLNFQDEYDKLKECLSKTEAQYG